MKILIKQSELDALARTVFNYDLTVLEAWKHIYYFGRFVHARQKVWNWERKTEYYLEKGREDRMMFRFRDQLKDL